MGETIRVFPARWGSAMTQDSSVAVLLTQLRAGDEEAAARLFHQFAQRLVALAHAKLGRIIRQKVDPEDVLQSVLSSFFARQARGDWELRDWDSLWGLLAQITSRKCGRWSDYFQAACRDTNREVSRHQLGSDASAEWEPASPEPTPFEVALLAETVDHLLARLDERDRAIAELSLQGAKPPDISARVGCTERTVQRVMARLRKKLERLRDEGAAATT